MEYHTKEYLEWLDNGALLPRIDHRMGLLLVAPAPRFGEGAPHRAGADPGTTCCSQVYDEAWTSSNNNPRNLCRKTGCQRHS